MMMGDYGELTGKVRRIHHAACNIQSKAIDIILIIHKPALSAAPSFTL
jgi:hypothetical protein